MIIHVVQPGDTIHSISDYYNISATRLILENGITNPDNLAIGQTIVIVQPEITYTIQQGDTLLKIAEFYGISLMELLRNNPYLSDQEFLYPGETIVIKYQTEKSRTVTINGYIFSYVDRSVLLKTLPFLTYLTIFNYRITAEGEIIYRDDDTETVNLAKIYGVVPLMFVSTMTDEGLVNREVGTILLSNPSVQERLHENALRIMEEKGFQGINIYIENINTETLSPIVEYLSKGYPVFHSKGYKVIVTITPATNEDTPNIDFDRIVYSQLVDFVDGIIFTSYDWAKSYSYPNSIFPVNIQRELLDYLVSVVPPEKIFSGITALGYDWTLPYIPGTTQATVITYDSAVQIAADNGIPIQFSEIAQSPYFYYVDGDEVLHIIWTKDARSFDARGNLVVEYSLLGFSLWTIMQFDAQMWFLYNNQYYIERLMGIN